jgi:hypothetical protein
MTSSDFFAVRASWDGIGFTTCRLQASSADDAVASAKASAFDGFTSSRSHWGAPDFVSVCLEGEEWDAD